MFKVRYWTDPLFLIIASFLFPVFFPTLYYDFFSNRPVEVKPSNKRKFGEIDRVINNNQVLHVVFPTSNYVEYTAEE